MPEPVIVNFWGVVAASLVSVILGYVWYGPLFGRIWMREAGIESERLRLMPRWSVAGSTIIGFVASLVMFYILDHFVTYANATTVAGGSLVGFWAWMGFVAVALLNALLYEARSLTSYIIHIGYYLIVLAIGGAILAIWK